MSSSRAKFLKAKEDGFNASAFNCKLGEYNALRDPNMQHYFENKKVQNLLYQTGQIDRHGRIIDRKKNEGKLKILEREFAIAEKIEDRRRQEELEMRYRVQRKRFAELEKKRKEDILQRLKADHELSKEILSIMRNSNPGNKITGPGKSVGSKGSRSKSNSMMKGGKLEGSLSAMSFNVGEGEDSFVAYPGQEGGGDDSFA